MTLEEYLQMHGQQVHPGYNNPIQQVPLTIPDQKYPMDMPSQPLPPMNAPHARFKNDAEQAAFIRQQLDQRAARQFPQIQQSLASQPTDEDEDDENKGDTINYRGNNKDIGTLGNY